MSSFACSLTGILKVERERRHFLETQWRFDMANTAVKKSSSSSALAAKKTLALTSMVLPGAIWLLLLRYLPIFGIVIAFKKYAIYYESPSLINNIIHSKWVGLDNFNFIFATTEAAGMIRNTLLYNAFWIVLGIVISVAYAILISELTTKFLAKFYQTLMFFPFFLSWVVVSYFFLAFLQEGRGLIPNMQENAGVAAESITKWYADPKPWPVILTIANVWKNTGYSCMLYLAAITGIDTTQYEAARIDGANKLQQIMYVTLPHLRTIIIILFIMAVGRIFNADFGLFYNVPRNSGPLFSTTLVVDTYVFRALMVTGNIGMSGAAGLLQNVVGFICIMTANGIVRKVDPESSMF